MGLMKLKRSGMRINFGNINAYLNYLANNH